MLLEKVHEEEAQILVCGLYESFLNLLLSEVRALCQESTATIAPVGIHNYAVDTIWMKDF